MWKLSLKRVQEQIFCYLGVMVIVVFFLKLLCNIGWIYDMIEDNFFFLKGFFKVNFLKEFCNYGKGCV